MIDRRLLTTLYSSAALVMMNVLAAGENASTMSDAQTEAASEQDLRIVPGTRWSASITIQGNNYVSCQINLNLEDGVQLRYAIGSNGSLVLLLNDKYMEAQVSEVLGWTEGQSYRAILFLDDKKIDVQARSKGLLHSLPFASARFLPIRRTRCLGLRDFERHRSGASGL